MKLRDYLKKNGLKVCWFANQIGYTQGHLCNVMNKHYNPSRRFMKSVELFTKGEVKEEDFELNKESEHEQRI